MEKKITRTFASGVIAGIVATTMAFAGVNAIKKVVTPTEEFVAAKSIVASYCSASTEDVKLYRHDFDSRIWDKVSNVSIFGSENGLYPQYVYTADVKGDEEILAVVIAARDKKTLDSLSICGRPINEFSTKMSYETDRFEPVYVAKINIAGIDDINSVMNGIDVESRKL